MPRLVGKSSLLLLCCMLPVAAASAQTVRVDMTPSHSTNSFVPTKTLGAGIESHSSEGH